MRYRRPGVDLLVGKVPWRMEWLPAPVFLPGESHGHRSIRHFSGGLESCHHMCTQMPWDKSPGVAGFSLNELEETSAGLKESLSVRGGCWRWGRVTNRGRALPQRHLGQNLEPRGGRGCCWVPRVQEDRLWPRISQQCLQETRTPKAAPHISEPLPDG